jgi:hypothetical protein
MPKTKTRAKVPSKGPPRPAAQRQPETPQKNSGPLPASRATPPTTALEQNSGSVGQARTMTGLQRTVGNARLSRMVGTTVQTRLTVGAPHDPYEPTFKGLG